MFVENAWYVAGWASDFQELPVAKTILGKDIVLFRSENGDVSALDNNCPHRFVPLSLGRITQGGLQCAYHGLKFNGSGHCIEAPGESEIPRNAKVRAYPTVERWRWIWVWTGDPAKANPDLIPDYHWLSDPDWNAVTGNFTIAANYELLLDNLHNHTHLQFVHGKTIGTDQIVSATQSVKRIGDNIHVTRWLMDQQPPKLFALAGGFQGKVDRWFNSTYLPPAGVVLDIGCADAGSGAPQGNRSRGIEIMSLHAICPETPERCSYYWAYVRSFKTNDTQLSEVLKNAASATFKEDVEILEEQQAQIARRDFKPYEVHLRADAGGIQVKRILKELRRTEMEAATACDSQQ